MIIVILLATIRQCWTLTPEYRYGIISFHFWNIIKQFSGHVTFQSLTVTSQQYRAVELNFKLFKKSILEIWIFKSKFDRNCVSCHIMNRKVVLGASAI